VTRKSENLSLADDPNDSKESEAIGLLNMEFRISYGLEEKFFKKKFCVRSTENTYAESKCLIGSCGIEADISNYRVNAVEQNDG
jgi:hypothetical protein